MKKRIATDLLKLYQGRSMINFSPHLIDLHRLSYDLIADMITDIKRPFTNICIHGKIPRLILPFIRQHNQRFDAKFQNTNITLVDHIRNPQFQELLANGEVKEVRYVDNNDSFLPEEDRFDLVLTCLQTHHCNSQQQLFIKYLRTLKPDGALVGSSFAQGTLSELYWAYLMAQNQRHGGMSPKVIQHSSLGEIGSNLTSAKYQMVTILSQDHILQLQSVVDLLTLLQQMGESGYLRGRRKGVYKDLMIAACGLYTAQFNENDKITATLSLSKFIGWKYHSSQPKKLSRGQQVGSIEFADELRKHGDEVESYIIEEGQQPKRTK